MPEGQKNYPPSPSPKGNGAVREILLRRIEHSGSVSVAEYMELALGHSEHGYYMSGQPFGTEGDFTTAPEISQMFGEMIAACLTDAWMQMGRPESVQLIELGPGRGTLAADVMRTISAWPDFKNAVQLHLVETSPKLRQQQFDLLRKYNPIWHDRLEDVPQGFCFILANEFFDALPIHQFVRQNGVWRERHIGYDKTQDKLIFVAEDSDLDIPSIMPEAFLHAPEGSIFEVSPASLAVMEEIVRRVAANDSVALLIDYGHDQAGLGDTLQAVYKHKFADVLDNIGKQDLTAHVDFGTLRTLAEQSTQVSGVVGQGAFLTSLGIFQRAEALREHATEAQRKEIDLALHRLVAPSEMGVLFKVMALSPKGSTVFLAGFERE